jgi:5S rRNA maturation endonuclease (ribonuclease M5)
MSTWERVTRARKCPICGKPDWCLIRPDLSAAICPRTESKKFVEGSGYLHVLRETEWSTQERAPEKKELPEHNEVLATLARKYYSACDEEQQVNASERMQVGDRSLRRLGMGWFPSQAANTFPMFRYSRRVIGIRVRGIDGDKWAVKGSKQGLFIPTGLDETRCLFVCEGPTDTAAMLDMGFNAVGRPSCLGGKELLVELLTARKNKDVVIMADGDDPGQDGARRLAQSLSKLTSKVVTCTPPEGYKDVRAWYRGGELRREEVIERVKEAACQRGTASSQTTT